MSAPFQPDPGNIWRQRLQRFWKEAVIYWALALRSGLSLFLLLVFIAGSYAYAKVLSNLPEGYPFWRITTPLLGMVLAWNPLRTFLREPDPIFLMPAETRLSSYFRRCLAYNFTLQAVWLGLCLALVWPLYEKAAGSQAILPSTAILVLLASKALALGARFGESRLVNGQQRLLLAAIRWTGSVAIAHLTLTSGWASAVAAAVGSGSLFGIGYLLSPKHGVNWSYLIRKEADHLRVHYTFFSWFADVPQLPAKARPRRMLAGMTRWLPMQQNRTYHYLYIKTFVRSEAFAILCRLALVGWLLVWVSASDMLRLSCYAGLILLAATSVAGLDQFHKYSFWLKLYPVHRRYRPRAIVATGTAALAVWNFIVGVALLWFTDQPASALAAWLAGFAFVLLYGTVFLRRRAQKTNETWLSD